MTILSLVVPVYCEAESLCHTVPSLLALQSQLNDISLQLVFVDDGSTDRSVEILRSYQVANPGKLLIVKLTRNFGAVAAVQAGFTHASGDCVIAIAADLQDPPELIPEMVQHWRNGVKAVFAVRGDREDSLGQRLTSGLYYRLFRRFAIKGYPAGGFDLMLLDRQVVDEINRIREKNTHLMSLVYWLGHPHVLIPYTRRARHHGVSKWSFGKKLKLFLDSFVAFSYAPIRFLSLVGVLFAIGAFMYAALVLYHWATHDIRVEGWTALMIFIAFTAGVQMTMLGMLGEYLWRTLDEVRRRPEYVVDAVLRD